MKSINIKINVSKFIYQQRGTKNNQLQKTFATRLSEKGLVYRI